MARILVVEDERAVREFVRRALVHHGHDITLAEDGLDALNVLSKNEFDLLLTDIVMPGMDGIALALKVARDKPDLKILLMSGFSAERQRAHNLGVLIHRVIVKPFTLRDICESVDDTLAGKVWPTD
ncbi:MAG: two-component system cell cycle response regulator CpdR [Alphaproteobacteria bacterium]|jgi:two-component system cell cycle response regulator CpdR